MPKPLTNRIWNADLRGEDGNAFVILATVSRIIKETLGADQAAEYKRRAMSGDYENLLAVTREYVAIRDVGRLTVEMYDEEDE